MSAPLQKISQQAIEEFKAIFHEEFGAAISDDDAQEMALRLLQLFSLLAHEPENSPNHSQSPTDI
jgi:hypothetical protein